MEENSPFWRLNGQLSLSDVLDNIDVGIIIYDAAGNFLFMNTVMVNWRNIPRQEYLKMNVRDFYSLLDVCVFDLVCQKKQRVSRMQYYKNIHKGDQTVRTRIVTGTPIFDGEGNVKYVVMMLQDVDEFENRRKSLLEQHKVLIESSEVNGPKDSATMVAQSPEMLRVLSIADTVAPIDPTILLLGESGSGKEVFAHYIHRHSQRSKKPMITVNCAALPENLIEAELFGYEKGSFTGADRSGKVGLVEAANGGTLFLDEINSLPLIVQGKVLRMIEEKSVRRVGSNSAKKVDFRLIAATNEDLLTLVRAGRFREDLYYRLNVIPLVIPPLRSRRVDIIPLSLHFLHYYCQQYGLKKNFSDDVLKQLQAYHWPGNVRELRNVVERMVVMTPNSTTEIRSIPQEILCEDLDAPALPDTPPVPARSASELTRERVMEALSVCRDRSSAAAYLGVSRRKLQYKIREYGLSPRCRYEDKPS